MFFAGQTPNHQGDGKREEQLLQRPVSTPSQGKLQQKMTTATYNSDESEGDDFSLCFDCGEAFNTDAALMKHKCSQKMNEVGPSQVQQVSCMLCEKSFDNITDHLTTFHKVSRPKMDALVAWGESLCNQTTLQGDKENTPSISNNIDKAISTQKLQEASGAGSSTQKGKAQPMQKADNTSNEIQPVTRVNKFPCHECDFMANDSQAAQEHFKLIHGLHILENRSNGPIKISAAVTNLTTNNNEKQANTGQYACMKCSYSGQSKTALSIHFIKSHPPATSRKSMPVSTPVAPVTAVSTPPINIKAEKVPQITEPVKEKVFSCKKCGFQCSQKEDLLKHFTKEHMIKVNKKKDGNPAPEAPKEEMR